MANDYTSSSDCLADLSEASLSSSDYPQLSAFITAASRLIDNEMGRWAGFFYPTTDATTKYYDGSGMDEQDIGEWASVTSLAVSEEGETCSTGYTSWTLNTDYMLYPYNYSAEGVPITKLLIDDNGNKIAFYHYRKGIKVTGVPGYGTSTPAVVAQAAKMQVVRWMMRAKQGYQDVGASVEIGGITVKGQTDLDPDVKALLFPLKLELSTR